MPACKHWPSLVRGHAGESRSGSLCFAAGRGEVGEGKEERGPGLEGGSSPLQGLLACWLEPALQLECCGLNVSPSHPGRSSASKEEHRGAKTTARRSSTARAARAMPPPRPTPALPSPLTLPGRESLTRARSLSRPQWGPLPASRLGTEDGKGYAVQAPLKGNGRAAACGQSRHTGV